eukprot:TRINITY_DN5964_c0_g1_i1.p1 TRINITY_DN5964_c0_g1~~TRINITY_DN5964_c0_g1_i1.p1  ORF type:complete len:381 (+),score=110.70 TRINITY_DN5964_c0_g1_i1:130-1272(+)
MTGVPTFLLLLGAWGAAAGEVVRLTQKDKDVILASINYYRCRHEAESVAWDAGLESAVTKWSSIVDEKVIYSDEIKPTYSPQWDLDGDVIKPAGEIFAFGTGILRDEDPADPGDTRRYQLLQNSIKNMYQQGADAYEDLADNATGELPDEPPRGVVSSNDWAARFFAQMVWSDSERVGCARWVGVTPRDWAISCWFYTDGNVPGMYSEQVRGDGNATSCDYDPPARRDPESMTENTPEPSRVAPDDEEDPPVEGRGAALTVVLCLGIFFLVLTLGFAAYRTVSRRHAGVLAQKKEGLTFSAFYEVEKGVAGGGKAAPMLGAFADVEMAVQTNKLAAMPPPVIGVLNGSFVSLELPEDSEVSYQPPAPASNSLHYIATGAI